MIEIKLTDLPEFKDQLKITITLEKDGEGIKESVTTSPDPSPLPSSFPSTPPTKKRTKKESETKETPVESKKNAGDGNIFETPDVVSMSPATPTQTESSPASINEPKPKRRSGNMMGLEF